MKNPGMQIGMASTKPRDIDGLPGNYYPIQHETPATILMASEDDPDASALADIPLDALLVLLRVIIPAPRPGAIRNAKRWDVAQLRLVSLAHLAGLSGVADLSLTQLAKELGITRSLLSHYSTRLADSLGQESVRGGRSKKSRAAYKASATAYHQRAGHIMASNASK